MSVLYVSSGGNESSPYSNSRQVQKSLSEFLARLSRDDKNPDLWIKAAKAYLALGDLKKALKCGEVCLRLDEGHGEAGRLVSEVKDVLKALGAEVSNDVVLEVEESRPLEEEVEPESPPPKEAPTEERLFWVPEEERTRFGSDDEAREELGRELIASRTVTCPDCATLLDVEDEWCYGCGKRMKEMVETLEERLGQARARLEENEEDKDALFTLGAYLTVKEQHQEALEVLNRLTVLDFNYPGLWWLKARVFEHLGKSEAAQSALKRAIQTEESRARS